jgi:AcrR family transcriptional regulator
MHDQNSAMLEHVATTDSSNAPAGDRRVRRTRASLQRALIELVAEQDLSAISVADVVDRADVSRSTFYDHYQDVHELAEAACTSMIDDMLAPLTAATATATRPPKQADDPNPAVTAFFTHFAEHAGLYRSLLGPTGSARVIEHVRQRTMATARLSPMLPTADGTPERAGTDPSEDARDVPAAFVASALLGVATDWLQRGCPQTPRELTILTEPLLSALRNNPASPAPRASRRLRQAPPKRGSQG